MMAETDNRVVHEANFRMAATAPGWDAPVRPRRRRWIAVAVILLALAGAAGFYGWQTWLAPSKKAAPPPTVAVQRADLEETVSATGTLQPRDYVDVGTQISGQLRELHVRIGSHVKAGDLLAEIDPTVYRARVDADRAQLANLKAQLAAQQARVGLAEHQLTRQRNMMREEATSMDALQVAESALMVARAQTDSLQAQIRQTESQLRADEANLGYTRIYAPLAGTVVSQSAKLGQTLNANNQTPIILRIADLSTMTVNAQVSEADVSKLRVGMDVYFMTLGDSGKRWYGKLRQIMPTPQILNNVVLYDALFEVPNAEQVLMPQMTAQVFFVVAAAKDAVVVPVTALRPAKGKDESGASGKIAKDALSGAGADPRTVFENTRARVQVSDGNGNIESRDVQVGVVTRVSAQIVSGLEPGEQVVAGGPQSKGKKRKGG